MADKEKTTVPITHEDGRTETIQAQPLKKTKEQTTEKSPRPAGPGANHTPVNEQTGDGNATNETRELAAEKQRKLGVEQAAQNQNKPTFAMRDAVEAHNKVDETFDESSRTTQRESATDDGQSDDGFGEWNQNLGSQEAVTDPELRAAMSAASDWHFEILNLEDRQIDERTGLRTFPLRRKGETRGTVVYVKDMSELAGAVRETLQSDPHMDGMKELDDKHQANAYR